MKGLKHIFTRECKTSGVRPIIGSRWQCLPAANKIVIPVQDNNLALFIGFHELGHYILHRNSDANYDNLKERITIEIEADEFANKKMLQYGYEFVNNNATLGLIALYLLEGGQMESFSYEIENERFIVLKKYGIEIFSHFVSMLPMHPAI